MSIRDEIEAEIKAEQQRLVNQRMEAKKHERLEKTSGTNSSFGCGIALFVAFIILMIVIAAVGSGDSYDTDDWDFDGDVDINDAEIKLDWILENEE